ncbi:hypothetical protein PVAND_010430 [Polypedilum vanderplanki]|uniref:Uncharacterized protein n=1 Tax=Polypedilum vanderplanki TaxID=319348 RepID=A0A9J6CGP2_POLVA|nr:hypothetical protein PVAND_010430 [Polypedilum vanderplanki]
MFLNYLIVIILFWVYQLKFDKFGAESVEERDSDSAKGDDDLLNLIQIEANTLVDTVLEESVSIINNNSATITNQSASFIPPPSSSSYNDENDIDDDHREHELSRDASYEENSYEQPHPPSQLPLLNTSLTNTSSSIMPLNNNSDSENFAIKSDFDVIVKSPTIESMSGKSFEDVDDDINYQSSSAIHDVSLDNNNITATNIATSSLSSSSQPDQSTLIEVDIVQNEAQKLVEDVIQESLEILNDNKDERPISSTVRFARDNSNISYDDNEELDDDNEIQNSEEDEVPAIVRNIDMHKLHRVERKFEHLSSEVREDDPTTVDDLVNKEDISLLQTDFSKISWDESLSATTGELASSTPDNDIHDTILNTPTETRSQQENSTKIVTADLPKPTPRLKKSSTNDTNNSSMSSQVDDTSSVSSASHTLKTENESSDGQSAASEEASFQQKKQFWENFEHPIMPAPIPRPRIAKSQRDSKDSFDTEMSSLRSSKEIEEERLEDESFPISDRYDSDASEKVTVPAPQKPNLVTDMDKIEVCESSEAEDDGAKFYIGESCSNVIRKSASEKRADFAFDNYGYEYSIEATPKEDFVHQDIKIYDDTLLDKEEPKAHFLSESTGDDSKLDLMLEEKSEFEVSEKLSRQQSEEMDSVPVASSKPPVVHSPISTVVEMKKPLEIPEERVTVAKASAIEVLEIKEEPKKPIKLENLSEIHPSKENFRLDTVIRHHTEAEIEKTLEEVEESLSAVQEELIEVVKDGKLIKQSPSEFEIKILPDLKYPASIPEQEELPDTPKKEPKIKIKEPEKTRQSETEESQQSSNEDSFNKLDVTHRQKTKQGSNRWSATDIESSSESHYQSFEKTDSRPLSSDVENLVPYQSSEYETAQNNSIVSGSTTLDFHSAVSTLNSHSISSRDSMKSFESESSGNLASIETSEASETLVPSTMEEIDDGMHSDVISQDLEHDDKDKFKSLESEPSEEISPPMQTSITGMKRSHEMNFASENIDPMFVIEEKLGRSVEDLKYGSLEEHKFGSSLEEGSMLSVSISSASNLETMVEVHSEHADQLMGSLVGSYDSAKIFTSFTDDASGTTPPDCESTSAPKIESLTMMTSTVQDQDQTSVNTQITTTVEEPIEQMKKRGHKRADSTSVFPGGFVKAGSKESGSDSFEEDVILQEDSSDIISSEKDETHGESSDSDYDRYESEYARAYRLPNNQNKSKSKDKSKETLELDEKRFSSPGHSLIETIVEDVHAETEQSGEHVSEIKKAHEYDIPNIQVTDEPKTTSSTIQYAKQVEYKMSEEEYQELLDKKYASRLADLTKSCDDNVYQEDPQLSPGSDSFEMLNEPDLSDEFVIVEEVAKEAHELDQEGKSVSIQSTGKKYTRKHDEEMEKYVIKSAPAATDAGSSYAAAGFEFEDSPPQDEEQVEPMRGGNGYALEGRKGWVEMNLSDPANLRYPYDIDTRGVLEDIKEEDTDFEIGSSRISSFKDSYSSTPDYDALVRKLHSREHDNLSMNSLQEFESLEQVISLENRRQATQSSQESLSNGSYPKNKNITKSFQGDDISLSSLKEFEGLENACMEAHLLEIKAKEEAALLLSRSDDSNKSSGSSSKSSNGAKTSPKTTSSSPGSKQNVTTTTVTTSVIKEKLPSSHLEQQMAHEFQLLQQRAQEIMEDKSISIMETSTDSLEEKEPKQVYDKTSSQHVSSDSLDKDLKSGDLMTSSVDSIELSRNGGAESRRLSDVDSIEKSSPVKKRSDSIDSIEQQIADEQNIEMIAGSSKKVITKTVTSSGTDGQNVTTTTVTSTVTHYDMPQQRDISSDSLNARTEPELLLTSTESLETSSTATNATYQNETDSQMSGSITSCGSNTMIEMDPIGFYSPSSSSHQITSTTTTSTIRTSYTHHEGTLLDEDEEDFAPITFSVKKQNQ